METLAELTDIYSCGHRLDESPREIGFLRETFPSSCSVEQRRERMKEDGYLLMRGMLSQEDVLAARRYIVEMLASQKQIDPAYPVTDAVAVPGSELFFHPEFAQQSNLPLQHLLYAPDGNLMRSLVFEWRSSAFRLYLVALHCAGERHSVPL